MPADPYATLGRVPDGTRRRAHEILDALHAATGKSLQTLWGMGGGNEHSTGRAIDFMTLADRAAGDWIADYLWANRDRLRLTHMIWRQRIRSTVVSPGQWRAMADRGDPTQNHMDHVHVFFGSSDYTPPPARTGGLEPKPKPSPPTTPRKVLVEDGINGPATQAAIVKLTGSKRWPDWPAMQRWAGMTGRDLDGQPGPRTYAAIQRKVSAEPTGSWSWRWTRPEPTTRAIQAYINRGISRGQFEL